MRFRAIPDALRCCRMPRWRSRGDLLDGGARGMRDARVRACARDVRDVRVCVRVHVNPPLKKKTPP